MVERRAGADHQRPEADYRYCDYSVEAPRLGMGPGIEWPGHLAALVRVGAVVLPGAGVADVGSRSVARQPLVHVGLDPMEVLALRALPGVEVVVVGEAARPPELRATVRVLRHGIENKRDEGQEEPIPGGEDALRSDLAHLEVPTGALGSVTSVNRTSSGSSITTRFTVWRTPM